MSVLSEELIALQDVSKDWPTPHPPSRTTIRRWMNYGVRGVKLETVKMGWRVFTSREAINRFLENLNKEK